jgi:glycine/serine hydroxymethyltransferase
MIASTSHYSIYIYQFYVNATAVLLFAGLQGGPHNHTISGLAFALRL